MTTETSQPASDTKPSDTTPNPDTHFYDYYLTEHQNVMCRRLHFLGTTFGAIGIAKSIQQRSFKPIAKGVVTGYACAWVGHLFFEKNNPPRLNIRSKLYRRLADVCRCVAGQGEFEKVALPASTYYCFMRISRI